MDQKELSEKILDGNVLIAKFRGAVEEHIQLGIIYTFPYSKEHPENQGIYTASNLKYHCSWDWLMPVFLQISKKVEYSVITSGQNECCEIHTGYNEENENSLYEYEKYDFITERESNNTIENVWLAVVDYARWSLKNKVLNQNSRELRRKERDKSKTEMSRRLREKIEELKERRQGQ